MANQIYILVTKQNRFIISEARWIENTTIGNYTKVFHSPDNSKAADFSSPSRFYIDLNIDGWYDAFLVKKYNNRQLAENYIARMRPKYPIRNKTKSGNVVSSKSSNFRFPKPKIVDYIDLEGTEGQVHVACAGALQQVRVRYGSGDLCLSRVQYAYR